MSFIRKNPAAPNPRRPARRARLARRLSLIAAASAPLLAAGLAGLLWPGGSARAENAAPAAAAQVERSAGKAYSEGMNLGVAAGS